jgi:regulator of sigma E protease
VLLAGPLFNFLFAILAYWLMFVTGVQAPKAFIAAVEPDSVSARAGLQAGDEITTIGGRPVTSWDDGILKILDELIGDGRIEISARTLSGATRDVELDVRGRAEELTEPTALFQGLGMRPGIAAVAGAVEPNSPAERAGFQAGDLVVRADDQPIQGWSHWVAFLQERPGQTVALTVLRGERELALTATLDTIVENGKSIGRIGVEGRRDVSVQQRYGILESLPRGVEKTWETTAFTVTMLTQMVVGNVSLKNISGPLSIADIAGSAARVGLAYSLSILALLSISLGILNLLPIPVLDGGQIVYQLVEGIKGSPLSERAMIIGQQIGIFCIIALASLAFYNDIVRMFAS